MSSEAVAEILQLVERAAAVGREARTRLQISDLVYDKGFKDALRLVRDGFEVHFQGGGGAPKVERYEFSQVVETLREQYGHVTMELLDGYVVLTAPTLPIRILYRDGQLLQSTDGEALHRLALTTFLSEHLEEFQGLKAALAQERLAAFKLLLQAPVEEPQTSAAKGELWDEEYNPGL